MKEIRIRCREEVEAEDGSSIDHIEWHGRLESSAGILFLAHIFLCPCIINFRHLLIKGCNVCRCASIIYYVQESQFIENKAMASEVCLLMKALKGACTSLLITSDQLFYASLMQFSSLTGLKSLQNRLALV